MKLQTFVPERNELHALHVVFKTEEEQKEALDNVFTFIHNEKHFIVIEHSCSPTMIRIKYRRKFDHDTQSILITTNQFLYLQGPYLKANFERNMQGWKKNISSGDENG